MLWQLCDTQVDSKICTTVVWYVCYGVWSLMCTSHVAGNTQWLVLMGKLRKSRYMWGINAIARYDKDVVDVTVLGDDEWRRSWCRYQDDGHSALSSRNTLGNGKTANSKSHTSNVKMVVAGMRWWFALGNAEVEWWSILVSELKLPSLSSENTLGDTSHNSNKLKQ